MTVPRTVIAGATVALVVAASLALAGVRAQPPSDPLGGFVEIPAGPFTMGVGGPGAKAPDAFDNERWPPMVDDHAINVPTFYLARHEVTVAEFAVFARATGWNVEPRALSGGPTYPVAYVGWTDAVAYTKWRTSTLRSDSSTPAALARLLADGWRVALPTEAQWEKAAREHLRVYPWGDELRRDRATFNATGPTAVGATPCPECNFGLEDMAGNVWEWTRSPYQPYPYDEGDDRTGLDQDALWVIRGGSFADPPRLIRTTTRSAAEPAARRPFIGFRVALVRGR